jgi:RNA polymerase sigma-70 factor (ECF subfamily)
VRKLIYESDFSEDDALRLRNSEAAMDQGPSVEGELARRDYVVKLLEKLPAEDRTLMLLKEVEGHSVEELAQMTGLNQNTIKVKLFRARQKLLKAAERLDRTPGAAPA